MVDVRYVFVADKYPLSTFGTPPPSHCVKYIRRSLVIVFKCLIKLPLHMIQTGSTPNTITGYYFILSRRLFTKTTVPSRIGLKWSVVGTIPTTLSKLLRMWAGRESRYICKVNEKPNISGIQFEAVLQFQKFLYPRGLLVLFWFR